MEHIQNSLYQLVHMNYTTVLVFPCDSGRDSTLSFHFKIRFIFNRENLALISLRFQMKNRLHL